MKTSTLENSHHLKYITKEEESSINENDLKPNNKKTSLKHISATAIKSKQIALTTRENKSNEIEQELNLKLKPNKSEKSLENPALRNTQTEKNLNLENCKPQIMPSLKFNNTSRNYINITDVENITDRNNNSTKKALKSTRDPEETTANFLRRQRRKKFLDENHGFRN